MAPPRAGLILRGVTTRYELRARLSFPEHSRGLDETASVMSEWAREAAAVIAPELRWDAQIVERGSPAGSARWGRRHVVKLAGTTDEGTTRGRGEVLLAAGGDATRVGGNALVEIEAVGPTRYLLADNHCNVTHWDLIAAPLEELQIDRLRRALEEAVGASAKVGGERREPLAPAAQVVVASATAEDAATWMEDLALAGIACRGSTTAERVTLIAERATLTDVDALAAARVALGEVLSEAGHDDWHERARDLLVRLR